MEIYQDLWDKTLNNIQHDYSEEVFQEIFMPSKKVVKYANGSIYVLVPDIYVQTKMNKVYISKLNEELKKITDNKINVKFKFIIEDELKELQPLPSTKGTERLEKSNLNEHYSFESFVVGKSNMFALRMAMKVAEQPGVIANPLYIFGGVGLGKTHLMQAIGNYILDKDINQKIVYVQSNEFIVDYSKATQNTSDGPNRMAAFDNKYGNLDILLVDDIQMLDIGKKSQQEFFKLFNDLYEKKKQIVITSDRPADCLTGIMDRLTSRFSWGMTVDIKLPTLSQRVDILKRKLAETSTKVITDDVLEFIANNFVDNIRELEGALNRVIFYSDVYNIDITLETAKEALEPLLKSKKNNNKNNGNYENFLSVVADFYNITVSDIIGTGRNSKFVLPRHIAMYILKTKYNLTFKKIADIIGGKDHTTIMNGVNKITEEVKTNKELSIAIESILKKVD